MVRLGLARDRIATSFEQTQPACRRCLQLVVGVIAAMLVNDARMAATEAAAIIQRLAETIDDQALRNGFVTAIPVQAVLQQRATL